MNQCKPVIAITDTETYVFNSVLEAATNYGCRPSHITNLIERNQVFRDGRTCFDYYEGPEEEQAG